MSFGFGVGDFLAVLKLVNKVRKDFVGAPKQLKDISDELRGLSIVLGDVDVHVSDTELSQDQRQHLAELVSSCQAVLQDLQDVMTKFYHEPQPQGPDIGTRVKRAWKRVRWEPEEIRQLRERIVSVVVLLNAYLEGITSRNITAVRTGVERLTIRECDKERAEILDWLTTVDYVAQHYDFISRRQEGTGQWLLESIEYQNWVDPSSATRTLYCPGMPGAGKTILTSIVIDDQETRISHQTPKFGLAYIYFNFRRQEQQKYLDVLLSLLRQLCQGLPSLPDFVVTMWNVHRQKNTRPSPNEILEGLRKAAAAYTRQVFIVADAIDESLVGCRTSFLDAIFRLQDMGSTPIFIFATSRFIPDIADVFARRCSTKSVEIRASRQDIERYVEGHLSALLPFVRRNGQLQMEIKDAIAEAVDGMFLLAQIYHSSLGDKATPKSIRNALSNFKRQEPGLSEESKVQILRQAYDDVMERITGQPPGLRDLAVQTLSWITCATRPLKTAELQHALAVEIGLSKLDPDNMPEVEDILGVCAGLVTRDEESDVIRLVHYTTQEYFEETQAQWFPNAETMITKICATYLSFEVFASGPCKSDPEMITRVKENAFYGYVARNFPTHATKAATACPELISLFKDNNKLGSAYQAYRLWDWSTPMSRGHPLTGSHTASGDVKFSVDQFLRDSEFETALAAARAVQGIPLAVQFRLPRVVEGLLDLGCDPRVGMSRPVRWWKRGGRAKFTDSPLHLAILTAQTEVVRMLLSTGNINVNNRGFKGCTPLHFAVRLRDRESTKLLLSYPGIDVNRKEYQSSATPLHYLVWGSDDKCDIAEITGRVKYPNPDLHRDEELTSLLLSAPCIDVLAGDEQGHTALSIAGRRGSAELVKLLLTRWTPEAKEEWHSTAIRALHEAAEHNHPEVIRLLLGDSRLGTNLTADIGEGSAICRAAVKYRFLGFDRLEAATILLDSGQIPVAEEERAMFAAVGSGSSRVVKLLLDRGKIVPDKMTDDSGRTPIQLAHDLLERLDSNFDPNDNDGPFNNDDMALDLFSIVGLLDPGYDITNLRYYWDLFGYPEEDLDGQDFSEGSCASGNNGVCSAEPIP